MRVILITSLLIGCGAPGEPDAQQPLDSKPVLNAMSAVQVEPIVAWVEQPIMVMGGQADCPALTVIEQTADSIHEQWVGGCQLNDGRSVAGELERFESPDGAWIIGRDFRVFDGDELVMGLDGAIEVTPTNALWLIEIAAATCGTSNWSCEHGILGLDLSYTIYPAIAFPTDYDATVSGTVATETGTTTLDGAWSTNIDTCADEPTSGILSIQNGAHHAIQHNGEQQCDGCSSWQVQGQQAPPLCRATP